MNRRNFMTGLGLGSVALVAAGRPLEAAGPDIGGEVLEVRVYGGLSWSDRLCLLRRRVPTIRETQRGQTIWYGPKDLSLVLDGPITVTAVACQAPAAFRSFIEEVPMVISPDRADKGGRAIVALPERLLILSVTT